MRITDANKRNGKSWARDYSLYLYSEANVTTVLCMEVVLIQTILCHHRPLLPTQMPWGLRGVQSSITSWSELPQILAIGILYCSCSARWRGAVSTTEANCTSSFYRWSVSRVTSGYTSQWVPSPRPSAEWKFVTVITGIAGVHELRSHQQWPGGRLTAD